MNKNTKVFLDSLVQISEYWANLGEERIEPSKYENEIEYRINGAIHSILAMVEGESAINNFTPYNISTSRSVIGENIYLPRAYFERWEKAKKVEKKQ